MEYLSWLHFSSHANFLCVIYFQNQRLALKTTEVNWFKEKDLDIVHGRYTDKQFKFLNPGKDDNAEDNVQLPFQMDTIIVDMRTLGPCIETQNECEN